MCCLRIRSARPGVNWSRAMYFAATAIEEVERMVAVFDDYVVWRSKHCKIRNAQVK